MRVSELDVRRPGVTVRYELTYPRRPVSLNASYGHSRHERTEHVIEWRDTFTLLAKEARIPKLDRIAVTVVTKLHGRMQDIGNNYVSAKAAIDGLVRARVIPDDTGDHLVSLTFLPPERVPANVPCSMTLLIDTIDDLPQPCQPTMNLLRGYRLG